MSEIADTAHDCEDWPYVSKIYLEDRQRNTPRSTTCPAGATGAWVEVSIYVGEQFQAGASASTCSRLCATLPMRLVTDPAIHRIAGQRGQPPPARRGFRLGGGGNALPATAMAAG